MKLLCYEKACHVNWTWVRFVLDPVQLKAKKGVLALGVPGPISDSRTRDPGSSWTRVQQPRFCGIGCFVL